MKTFAHGDSVTAANLNAIDTTLDDAYARIGDVAYQALAPGADDDNNTFFFIHRYRYLYFKSTGEIASLDGTNTAGLSEKNDTFTALDLDGLNWLSYGQAYVVTGCEMACEDWEA